MLFVYEAREISESVCACQKYTAISGHATTGFVRLTVTVQAAVKSPSIVVTVIIAVPSEIPVTELFCFSKIITYDKFPKLRYIAFGILQGIVKVFV
jgi:hypothetical protein